MMDQKKRTQWTASMLALALSLGTLAGCGGSRDTGTPPEEAAQPSPEVVASAAPVQESAAPVQGAETVTVTDMAGRTVTLPAQIDKIATFGVIGVINAFVELMGCGDKICNQMTATSPGLTAGSGISVTRDAWTDNSCAYEKEDVLKWDPDVIIGSSSSVKDAVLADPLYSDVSAVKNGALYDIPTVGHVWGNRTVEQPLTIFWTMHKLYPELITTEELSEKIYQFYDHFFQYQMSDEQIAELIAD